MSPRAIHLADVLGAQLAELGPGVRALSVDECSTWHLIKIGTADGAVLQRLADDLQLDQAWTGSRVWWRRMLPRPSGEIVLSASAHRAVEVRP